MDNVTKVILGDLEKRELEIVGFVTADPNGKLQYMGYSEKGLVDFISEKADNIQINEKLEGRMVRPMVELTQKPKES